MNKQELVAGISEKSGLTKKDSEAALKGFLETVEEALVAGDKVQLVGHGTYEIRERAAREGRNPATGEPLQIQASKSVGFKVGKALKDAVNGR